MVNDIITINNSYNLYKSSKGDKRSDPLSFRMTIIKEWQREYKQQKSNVKNNSKLSIQDMIDETVFFQLLPYAPLHFFGIFVINVTDDLST